MRCPICLPISCATEEIVVRNGPGSIHPVSISAYPALRIAVQMERFPAVCLGGWGGVTPRTVNRIAGPHRDKRPFAPALCTEMCPLI